MRKQLFHIVLKELLLQSLILLVGWASVNFILPVELLHLNVWGKAALERPLKTEYVIVILTACNMIRLGILALLIIFRKESSTRHSRLSAQYAHY